MIKMLLQWFSASLAILIVYKFYKYKMSIIMKNEDSLSNKVVLITGASSGIGEATAHKFFAKRCKLILAARRMDELERVKRDLLKDNNANCVHEPLLVRLDLEDLKSIPSIVNDILQNVGEIDIVINNAGIGSRSNIMGTDIEVYKKAMTVNFFGQIVITKAVLEHMIRRKDGHILFVSTLQSKYCLPNRSVYAASKHALHAFCECLRSEVQKYNIKVSAVYPPYVSTSLSLNALTGNGEKYGIMDKNTANGESPYVIGEDILNTIVKGKNEFTRATFSMQAYKYLRTIWPSLYFKIFTRLQNEADLITAKTKL